MKAKYKMFIIVWTNESNVEFEADVSGQTAEQAKKRFSKMYPEAKIIEVK